MFLSLGSSRNNKIIHQSDPRSIGHASAPWKSRAQDGAVLILWNGCVQEKTIVTKKCIAIPIKIENWLMYIYIYYVYYMYIYITTLVEFYRNLSLYRFLYTSTANDRGKVWIIISIVNSINCHSDLPQINHIPSGDLTVCYWKITSKIMGNHNHSHKNPSKMPSSRSNHMRLVELCQWASEIHPRIMAIQRKNAENPWVQWEFDLNFSNPGWRSFKTPPKIWWFNSLTMFNS